MNLYAATGNQGKLAEFTASASPAGIGVLPLPGLAEMPEPVEDADTFQGNADLKARAYSLLAPGLLVFADDSGLEVHALNGAPGVRSARFADDFPHLETGRPRSGLSDLGGPPLNPTATKDDRNNALLLHLMQSHTNRTARFVCALALARDGEILLRATGSVEGEILLAPRGTNGFGYDPLFLLPTLGLTTAELAPDRKWELSHRGKAFRSLLSQLGGTEL